MPDVSLDTVEHRLNGEEKQELLNFMRKMLQWGLKDRCDLHDIFMDEWLLADLIESGELVRE